MRGRQRTGAEAAEVTMTPMLDVVFILLIFFIVTSTFAQEKAIKLEPPGPTDGAAIPGRSMLITISADSLVRVNGRATDIGAVRAAIERVKAEDPEILVSIYAHPKSKTGVISLVRDAAYNAGYTEGVSLSLSREI